MFCRMLAAVAAIGIASSAASAQSMTPMRGEVTSFTDEFAVRVFPRNPYRHRILVAVRVYDEKFRPLEARVSPANIMLGANGSRPVTVVVGFDGARERRVRICTESIPFPDQQTRIKAQICGRFLARRY
jgi:hypothetical protein